MENRKIIQIVTRYRKGEGVGNTAAAIDELLKKNGYDAIIYDKFLDLCDLDSELFSESNIVLYHMYSLMDPLVKRIKCKKVLVFHNITTPEIMEGMDNLARIQCAAGWYDTFKSHLYFDWAIVFSDYSKKCLIEAGWKEEKIIIFPIMVRLDKFQIEPSQTILEKYDDDYVNVLFAGRVYPNKRQEDLIAAVAAYKEKYGKKVRLLLVGNISLGNYYNSLLTYARKLGVANDVIFSGFVSFAEYVAYYHVADVFLCMSAHEGFCIPLVEAMNFELPIIAYDGTAVSDTLGESGVLLQTRDAYKVALEIHRLMNEEEHRNKVLEGQRMRLKQLTVDVSSKYMQYMNALLETEYEYYNVSQTEDIPTFEFTKEIYIRNTAKRKKFSESKVCIIYGAGQAGIRIYNILKKTVTNKNIVFCDKYKGGEKNDIYGGTVLTPADAVENYADAVYIISIQDKEYIMDAVIVLTTMGIGQEQILVYDETDGIVY